MWEEIKWKEPREFLQEADRQTRARMTPGRRWTFAMGTVMLLLLIVAWNRDFSKISPELTASILLFAILWAWCVYWVRPWLRERQSSHVRFGLGISRRRGLMEIFTLSFRDLRGHCWRRDGHYVTLILLTRKRFLCFQDSFYAIGVPDRATRENASAFLIRKGIPEMPEGTSHLQTPRFRNLTEAHGMNLVILPALVFILVFGKIFGG